MIKEALDDIIGLIVYHKDSSDCSGAAAMAVFHVICGLIGSILIGVYTPIGWWMILSILLSVVLFFIWQLAPKGKLALGYFIAMSFFSGAWVVYLPLASIFALIALPLIIYDLKGGGEK